MSSEHSEQEESFSDVDSQEIEEDIRAYLESEVQKEKIIAIRPSFINNEPALSSKLLEFQLGGLDGKVPWLETLAITPSNPLTITDKNADKPREDGFYNHAVLAVVEAHKELAKLGVPYRRPEDYFAESLKTDEHMQKVKIKLENEKGRIERSESRKRMKELKKFGKQVQVQKTQERAQKKNEYISAIKKWRKDREHGGTADLDIEAPQKAQKPQKPEKHAKSKKRVHKDQKYGFGGQKRQAKRNNEDSYAQGTLSTRTNKQLEPDLRRKIAAKRKGPPNSKGGKPKQRPGKKRRMTKR